VLLRALPFDSEFKTELREAAERAKKPPLDRLRERQAYYNQREGTS
jgi:hypothetical protein